MFAIPNIEWVILIVLSIGANLYFIGKFYLFPYFKQACEQPKLKNSNWVYSAVAQPSRRRSQSPSNEGHPNEGLRNRHGHV